MKFEKISIEQYEKDIRCKFDIPYEDIKLPHRGTAYSAGYDIYSVADFTLLPGEHILLPTGIKVELDIDKWLQVLPRSGSGFKYGTVLANTVGVIDADYYNNPTNEGHVWVKILYPRHSVSDKPFVVKRGDAICQGILSKYYLAEDDDADGVRTGGFGSTGK